MSDDLCDMYEFDGLIAYLVGICPDSCVTCYKFYYLDDGNYRCGDCRVCSGMLYWDTGTIQRMTMGGDKCGSYRHL